MTKRVRDDLSHNQVKNIYFLHWNFDEKSCFVVFFHEWNEWKNPQFNFSSQNLSIEHNFFQMRCKSKQYMTPTFPKRIWKILLFTFLLPILTYLPILKIVYIILAYFVQVLISWEKKISSAASSAILCKCFSKPLPWQKS